MSYKLFVAWKCDIDALQKIMITKTTWCLTWKTPIQNVNVKLSISFICTITIITHFTNFWCIRLFSFLWCQRWPSSVAQHHRLGSSLFHRLIYVSQSKHAFLYLLTFSFRTRSCFCNQNSFSAAAECWHTDTHNKLICFCPSLWALNSLASTGPARLLLFMSIFPLWSEVRKPFFLARPDGTNTDSWQGGRARETVCLRRTEICLPKALKAVFDTPHPLPPPSRLFWKCFLWHICIWWPKNMNLNVNDMNGNMNDMNDDVTDMNDMIHSVL
jgi:hypothetical protein